MHVIQPPISIFLPLVIVVLALRVPVARVFKQVLLYPYVFIVLPLLPISFHPIRILINVLFMFELICVQV